MSLSNSILVEDLYLPSDRPTQNAPSIATRKLKELQLKQQQLQTHFHSQAYKSSLAKVTQELAAQRHSKGQLEQACRQLHWQVQALETEVVTLRQEKKIAAERTEEMERKCGQLWEQLQGLRSRSSETDLTLIKQNQAYTEQSIARLEQVQTSMLSVIQQKEAQNQHLKQQLYVMQQYELQLVASNEQLRAALASERVRLQEIKQEYLGVGRKLAGCQSERKRLEGEVKELRASRQNLQIKYMESKSVNNGLRYGYEMLALSQHKKK